MLVVEFETGHSLLLEEANCYLPMFYTCRRMLSQYVDAEYLDQHEELKNFYLRRRELTNELDVLAWKYPADVASALPTGRSHAESKNPELLKVGN
ncbi:MAG: hypothetical protein WCA08_01375 [Desulfoferrobacter sp.]